MIDGYYRITFTGRAGSGLGLLAFHAGVVAGADAMGSLFNGTYTEDPQSGELEFHVTMNAPAGITPVQTGIALAAPLALPMSGKIAGRDLDNDMPKLLDTPIGPVNVLFTKIRDFA